MASNQSNAEIDKLFDELRPSGPELEKQKPKFDGECCAQNKETKKQKVYNVMNQLYKQNPKILTLGPTPLAEMASQMPEFLGTNYTELMSEITRWKRFTKNQLFEVENTKKQTLALEKAKKEAANPAELFKKYGI